MIAHDPYLRSFGRRKGRVLSPRQAVLVETVLPRLCVDLGAPFAGTEALFACPVSDLWLEIGFGAGEHLCWQATNNPDVALIGCEPYLNGIASLLGRLDGSGHGNVRIHDGDAREILAWLPDAALGRIFLLHPDPWPKKRHHKRRLVSLETLAALARVLRPGGELRFASDDLDYVGVMWDVAEAKEAFRVAAAKDRPADWPITRYEEKALREGRRPIRLILTRR